VSLIHWPPHPLGESSGAGAGLDIPGKVRLSQTPGHPAPVVTPVLTELVKLSLLEYLLKYIIFVINFTRHVRAIFI